MTYALIFILLVLLELAYLRAAERLGIVGIPSPRGSSKEVAIIGCGIIFLFGVWLYAAFFGLSYLWFILGLSLIGLVSFADDIKPMPVSLRLVVHFSAVALMFYQFGIFHSYPWWALLLAIIGCVAILNEYNFMDGINGITVGYSFAVLLPIFYLNETYQFISQQFLLIVGISLLIFSFFNFRKNTRFFAGDVGSFSIAYIILFSLGLLIIKTQDICYLVFLAVYGVDATLTIIHRIFLHENIVHAHRKHAYQIMANELKIPHLVVVSIYMTLQLIISAGLIFLPVNHYIYLVSVIIALAVAYLLFMKRYYHLHEEYLKSNTK